MVNPIQQARKELGLHVADRIEVSYHADGSLAQAVSEHHDYVAGQVLATALKASEAEHALSATIDGQAFTFSINKTPQTDSVKHSGNSAAASAYEQLDAGRRYAPP